MHLSAQVFCITAAHPTSISRKHSPTLDLGWVNASQKKAQNREGLPIGSDLVGWGLTAAMSVQGGVNFGTLALGHLVKSRASSSRGAGL